MLDSLVVAISQVLLLLPCQVIATWSMLTLTRLDSFNRVFAKTKVAPILSRLLQDRLLQINCKTWTILALIVPDCTALCFVKKCRSSVYVLFNDMIQAWKSLESMGNGRMQIAMYAGGIVLSLMVYSVLQVETIACMSMMYLC